MSPQYVTKFSTISLYLLNFYVKQSFAFSVISHIYSEIRQNFLTVWGGGISFRRLISELN